MERPGLPSGALVGALVTAPLLAVLYLGWQLARLPFAPFDVFDWLARRLPGGVVTFGIDAMVDGLRALGPADLSTAAKTAEQILAVAGLFATGIIAGAVLFGVLRRLDRARGTVPGVFMGAAFGTAAALIGLTAGATAATGTLTGIVWTLAMFAGWGGALGGVYTRLARVRPGAAAPGTAGAGVPSAEVQRIDRRTFMVRLGGASAVITVAGAVLGESIGRARAAAGERGVPWSATHRLPNADAAVVPAPGTRPELTPVSEHYRIDINTRPPAVDERRWRLVITGLVEQPLSFTLDALRTRYPATHRFITLSCISNRLAGDLISTTRWTGISLRRVLADARVRPTATHLRIRSVDGFHEVVALDAVRADERIMLVYAWDGLPLPADHGFPLRIYIPDVYGMKQPKWIESIEAIDHPEAGYWVRRGWDAVARMKATSVIDTIATDMMLVQADRTTRIPVGGTAHAGARGISRVEVRVDDGTPAAARLRTPLSGLTWVLWRYDWPFQPGRHTFTVRCFDGRGAPQIAERTPVRPDGATGLHSENAML